MAGLIWRNDFEMSLVFSIEYKYIVNYETRLFEARVSQFTVMYMLRKIECVISGKVQGTLYRDFVRRKARGLGLVGTVENLPDGTVKVVAEGDESDLRSLIWYLKRGSMFSRVDAVDEKWSDAPQSFSDFQIVYKNFSDRI